MKKLLILACLCFIGMATKAQDSAGQIGTTKTLTNAQADTINVTVTGSRPSLVFKYDITKTSGTVAGTIVLQGKITNNANETWSTVNSYTLTDATANNTVALTANNYVYYRIITTTSGTQVSVHRKWLLYRGY